MVWCVLSGRLIGHEIDSSPTCAFWSVCVVCMCPCLSKLIEFCTQVAAARVASATSRWWGVAVAYAAAAATFAAGAIFKH